MKRIMAVVLLLSVIVGGCDRKGKPHEAVKPGRVVTTAAYEKYFGAAPTVDKGVAYAFVIYFPSRKEVGKVVPFPFFTFDEGSVRKVAMERLLGGMDIGSYRGEFTPYPAGISLTSLADDNGIIKVDFNKELASGEDGAAARALVLTLRQFKGVREVRLQAEGRESRFSAAATAADESVVLQPSPPRLLSVTAMRDKGAAGIEDINAFFDRPVEVRALKLLQPTGEPFAGELFHSVFDMAAVLKPADPSRFKAGMQVRVRWQVVDKLGRQAEGDSVWPLELKEH